MVVYFSGTGNSKYVAKRIADSLQEKLLCMNERIKSSDTGPVKTGEKLVVVVPTYAWRIPRVVSNCSYVGAVDIGDSAVEVPDFSDEVQEDELFSDGSEEVPETEDETVHPAATTEKVKVGIKGSYLAASQAVLDRINQIRREAYEEGV